MIAQSCIAKQVNEVVKTPKFSWGYYLFFIEEKQGVEKGVYTGESYVVKYNFVAFISFPKTKKFMKHYSFLLSLAFTASVFTACNNAQKNSSTTTNEDSVIAKYLNNQIAKYAPTGNATQMQIAPGLMKAFYAPSPEEYANPLMHKADVIDMIARYQDTRKAEVCSFMINADNLINYLTEVKKSGATDIQLILAQQPVVAGSVDDKTIIVVGVDEAGGAWRHIFGTLDGTKDAVLQHVKPLRISDKPGTAL